LFLCSWMLGRKGRIPPRLATKNALRNILPS
jgi:hypothetical protein